MTINERLTILEQKIDYIIKLLEPISKPSITLSDWLLTWLSDFRQNVAPSTLYKDTTNVNNNIIPHIGNTLLIELTTIQLQRFLNEIKAPRQRQHIYVLLKNSLNKAVQLGYIDTNPILSVIKPEHIPKSTETLSNDFISIFLNQALKTPYYNAYYILLNQGLRPSELLALTADNIGIDTLSISNSFDNKSKKISTTKTKYSVRHIPYFGHSKEILTALSKNNNSRLFPFSLRQLEDNFHNVIKACNPLYPSSIPRLSLYSLRHTCITNWAISGVHSKICMKWSGHNVLDTTLKYYTHVNNDWENEQKNKVVLKNV